LIAIDGQAITSIADVHLALWDKKPRDRVRVKVRGRHDLWREIDRDLDLQLAASHKVAENASESREASSSEYVYRVFDYAGDHTYLNQAAPHPEMVNPASGRLNLFALADPLRVFRAKLLSHSMLPCNRQPQTGQSIHWSHFIRINM
jgi:hypothetical protein